MSLTSVWRVLVCVVLALAPAFAGSIDPADPSGSQNPSMETGDAGDAAYRAGDYTSAKAHWLAALELQRGAEARGALFYNLGNAAFREGEYLVAVARFTNAIKLSPRTDDYWANLELARSKAGLDAADRGDLAATAERLESMFRITELETVIYALLALLGAAFLLEGFRGGRFSVFLCAVAGLLLVCGVSFRAWRVETKLQNGAMVITSGGSAMRSEPEESLPIIKQLDPGSLIEQIDSLPGWIRVEGGGSTGWIRNTDVLSLD